MQVNRKEMKTSYKFFVLFILFFLLVLSILLSTMIGVYKISVVGVIRAIFVEREGLARQIIWTIRFPRTIVAILVGISLSLAGGILQGVMQNPLASPNIIGVSSGAGVCGILILIVFPQYIFLVTPVSFLGAFLTTLLIYSLAWKDGIKPMRMILSGVAVSSFLGAFINTLLILFPDRVQGVTDFMVGGLQAKTWVHFRMLWPYTLIGILVMLLMSKRLNLLMLGDEMAKGLGLNVERTRFLLIAVSSLLAASAVSVVGLLGFVGLIVPHIARLLIGSDYRYLTPACILLGGIVLVICDLIARMLLAPMELPVGIIMAALGAPFFLFLLRGGLKKNA